MGISLKNYTKLLKIKIEKIGSDQFKGVKKYRNILSRRISSLDLKNSEDKIVESFKNLRLNS